MIDDGELVNRFEEVFPAVVTGVYSSNGIAPTLVAGFYQYYWYELAYDPALGGYQVSNPGRASIPVEGLGVTDSVGTGLNTVMGAPAYEINNQYIWPLTELRKDPVATSATDPLSKNIFPVFVWMRHRTSALGTQPIYEFRNPFLTFESIQHVFSVGDLGGQVPAPIDKDSVFVNKGGVQSRTLFPAVNYSAWNIFDGVYLWRPEATTGVDPKTGKPLTPVLPNSLIIDALPANFQLSASLVSVLYQNGIVTARNQEWGGFKVLDYPLVLTTPFPDGYDPNVSAPRAWVSLTASGSEAGTVNQPLKGGNVSWSVNLHCNPSDPLPVFAQKPTAVSAGNTSINLQFVTDGLTPPQAATATTHFGVGSPEFMTFDVATGPLGPLPHTDFKLTCQGGLFLECLCPSIGTPGANVVTMQFDFGLPGDTFFRCRGGNIAPFTEPAVLLGRGLGGGIVFTPDPPPHNHHYMVDGTLGVTGSFRSTSKPGGKIVEVSAGIIVAIL